MSAWLLEHEPAVRVAAFAIVLLGLALAESLRPRRGWSANRSARWRLHLMLAAVDTAVVRIVAPLGLAGFALWLDGHGGGLLARAGAPLPVRGILGFLALDAAVYLQHRAFHAVPALWRLHLVHHSDAVVDATTGIRFHPLEIVVSFAFKAAIVALTAPPVLVVVAFEILLNAGSLFTHANWFIPPAVDRWLRLFVVTPDMHRVHHSTRRAEQSANFGFSFSWWDRLFRTYADQPVDGHSSMSIGVSGVTPPAGITGLVALPWRRARDAPRGSESPVVH